MALISRIQRLFAFLARASQTPRWLVQKVSRAREAAAYDVVGWRSGAVVASQSSASPTGRFCRGLS